VAVLARLEAVLVHLSAARRRRAGTFLGETHGWLKVWKNV
jgi:hypothetical protein